MNNSSFASLCPALLARKGGAKPAMRPQMGLPANADNALMSSNLEDLGWNDMGDCDLDGGDLDGGNVVSLPIAEDSDALAGNPVSNAVDAIAEKLAMPAKKKSKGKARKSKTAAMADNGKRAAFTLRLDPERHLRLRLASTIAGSSAQQLVTEALDALLGKMPEIEHLAAQVKRD